MNQAILHVTISGRVQGVGYRAWLEDRARDCDLEGWVRNRADGSVEAVFAGPARLVGEMVALCRHGPPGARVQAVLDEPAEADQLRLRRPGERFSVLPTA
jgi:acylphosphatase